VRNNHYICREIDRTGLLLKEDVPTSSLCLSVRYLKYGTMNIKQEIRIGDRFGMLTVVECLGLIKDVRCNRTHYLCNCDCGNATVATRNALCRGNKKSCGCVQGKSNFKYPNRHGLSGTRIYNIWNNMKKRCYDTKSPYYENYGGRGIKMHEEWLMDVSVFYNYIMSLEGWDNTKLTLDRINNDKNYEPGNLRFTTTSIQNVNKAMQKNNTSGYKGVSYNKTKKEYCATIGVNRCTYSLGEFKSLKEAVLARNAFIIKNKLHEYQLQEYKDKTEKLDLPDRV